MLRDYDSWKNKCTGLIYWAQRTSSRNIKQWPLSTKTFACIARRAHFSVRALFKYCWKVGGRCSNDMVCREFFWLYIDCFVQQTIGNCARCTPACKQLMRGPWLTQVAATRRFENIALDKFYVLQEMKNGNTFVVPAMNCYLKPGREIASASWRLRIQRPSCWIFWVFTTAYLFSSWLTGALKFWEIFSQSFLDTLTWRTWLPLRTTAADSLKKIATLISRTCGVA